MKRALPTLLIATAAAFVALPDYDAWAQPYYLVPADPRQDIIPMCFVTKVRRHEDIYLAQSCLSDDDVVPSGRRHTIIDCGGPPMQFSQECPINEP